MVKHLFGNTGPSEHDLGSRSTDESTSSPAGKKTADVVLAELEAQLQAEFLASLDIGAPTAKEQPVASGESIVEAGRMNAEPAVGNETISKALKPDWKSASTTKIDQAVSWVNRKPDLPRLQSVEPVAPGPRAAIQPPSEAAGFIDGQASSKKELVARRIETLKEVSGAGGGTATETIALDLSTTAEDDVEVAVEIAQVAWGRAEREARRAARIRDSAPALNSGRQDQIRETHKKVRLLWRKAEAQEAAALKLIEGGAAGEDSFAESRIATARLRAEEALDASGVRLRRSPSAKSPAKTPASPMPYDLPSLQPALEDAAHAGLTIRARKRLSGVLLSFVAVVLFPVFLIGLYYLFISSDQYRSEMRFAVRGTERSTLENLGLNAIPGANEQSSDAYIVIDYIHSKQIILDIQQKLGIDLRQFYSKPEIDFVYRIDPNMPLDKFIDYWRWMVDAQYNSTTSITKFDVTAFNGQDAAAIANAVLQVSSELVNDLSTKARLRLISNAQGELARTEDRLIATRQAVALFRDTTQITDPLAQAATELAIIQGLEMKIIDAKSRRAVLLSTASPDSPSVRVLDRQIDADQAELDAKRQVIGSGGLGKTGDSRTLTTKLTEYNALTLQQEFAEKAYITALSSLETSQAEARRQDRYFAIAVEPNVPELALYPLRLVNTMVAFFGFLLVWLIGSLVTRAIRDHTS